MRDMRSYIILGCISIALTFFGAGALAASDTSSRSTGKIAKPIGKKATVPAGGSSTAKVTESATQSTAQAIEANTKEESGNVGPAPNNLIFMETAPKRDVSKNKVDEEKALHARGKGKAGQENFARCDSNKDGFLSSLEFRACFPRSGSKFIHVDANKDTKISEAELEEYISKLQ